MTVSQDKPTPLDETALDAFFDAGRADAVPTSPRLMERVMADAVAEADARELFAGTRRAPSPGLLARALATIGGWPAVAGLVTATAAGIWIGAARPEALGDLALGFGGDATLYDYAELMPGLDALDAEG